MSQVGIVLNKVEEQSKAVKVITEAVAGQLVEAYGRTALWLLDSGDGSHWVYLAYALVTLGPEEHVFLSSVLDDWGKEMTSLKVYEWMRENGNHFPRADILAVGRDGEERQHFLREFELYTTYPVYALSTLGSPITTAVRIRTFLLPDDSITVPTRAERPSTVQGPMAHARVSWWRVPPGYQTYDFLDSTREAS